VTEARAGRPDDDELELQQEILRLLAASPRGEATWEGILDWWLMERALERESRRVERALEALVAAGWLRRRRGEDGRERYGLVPERRAELEGRLDGGEWEEPA